MSLTVVVVAPLRGFSQDKGKHKRNFINSILLITKLNFKSKAFICRYIPELKHFFPAIMGSQQSNRNFSNQTIELPIRLTANLDVISDLNVFFD